MTPTLTVARLLIEREVSALIDNRHERRFHHEIEDMFENLTGCLGDWQSLGLRTVSGDTGQASMLHVKRVYASSPKGKAARKRYESTPARKAAHAARERARRARKRAEVIAPGCT